MNVVSVGFKFACEDSTLAIKTKISLLVIAEMLRLDISKQFSELLRNLKANAFIKSSINYSVHNKM